LTTAQLDPAAITAALAALPAPLGPLLAGALASGVEVNVRLGGMRVEVGTVTVWFDGISVTNEPAKKGPLTRIPPAPAAGPAKPAKKKGGAK
jgi:hypothetical protein